MSDSIEFYFWPYLIPGACYGIATVGFALTLKYLRAPDFTTVATLTLAGIISVYFSNLYGPGWGILYGCLSGIALGTLTGLLTTFLKIPLILSGIIVFTGSISLNYLLTSGGTISLHEGSKLMTSSFSGVEYAVLVMIALIVCVLMHLLMKTILGSFMLGMTGTEYYTRYRHRYNTPTTILLLAVSNGLVAVCAIILSFSNQSANADLNRTFLSIAIGAVFGVQAVTNMVSKRLDSYGLKVDSELGSSNLGSKVQKEMSLLLSNNFDDGSKLGFQCIMFIFGTTLLNLLSGFMIDLSAGDVFTDVQFDGEWEFLLTACVITIVVAFTTRKKS